MAKKTGRVVFLAAVAGIALAACVQEVGTTPSPQPSGAPPQTSPQTSSNTAPTIGGSPATAIAAGTTYIFQATATDSDGNALTFVASGLPVWMNIDAQAGTVYGTPSEADVGTTRDIVVSVSDGRASVSLPAFRITVTSPSSPSPGNSAPAISGTPPTSVMAGNTYAFTPAANDADGNTLGFSIAGKPSWATFSGATGALTGIPTTAEAGSYPNIVISVSDGTDTRSLPAFTITVSRPATGTAALSWLAPTQNTDGSPVTGLAGYRVYHGTTASALNDVFQVSGAASTSYTVSQLPSGTHYFAVAAYTTAGVEGAMSAVGSKTIP